MRPPWTINLEPGQSVYATVYKGGRPHWVLGTMVRWDGESHYDVLIQAADDDGLGEPTPEGAGACVKRRFHMDELRSAEYCGKRCVMVELVDIHVPVRDLPEAKRTATLMRRLGATIEDDLDIPARLHLIVCHYGARRVVIEIRGTVTPRVEVVALVKELRSG